MKIRFLRNCEYGILKKELFGGDEETSFEAGEEYEVNSIREIAADPSAADISFKNGWEAPYILKEDYEVVS